MNLLLSALVKYPRLSSGSHSADSGSACILEAVSVAKGLPWTDDPSKVGFPDIRPLNDAYTDDTARTADMARLGIALWDYGQWGTARKVRFARLLALATVREILPIALEANGIDATACRNAETLEQAQTADGYAAADAAGYAAGYAAADAAGYAAADAAAAYADAARAAYVGARAAYVGARAARAAAANAVLTQTVTTWIRCVEESENV